MGSIFKTTRVRIFQDEMTLKQDFPRLLWFSTVSNIPPILSAHLPLHATPIRRKNGRSLGTFQKGKHFPKWGIPGLSVTILPVVRVLVLGL